MCVFCTNPYRGPVWNTAHISAQVARLRESGIEVLNQDLARVSPLAYGHVIPNGTYVFDRPLAMVGELRT